MQPNLAPFLKDLRVYMWVRKDKQSQYSMINVMREEVIVFNGDIEDKYPT